MNDVRPDIAAIRLTGRPDVLFVDGAASDVTFGDRVTVEMDSGLVEGRVVIAPGQLAGDFGVVQSELAGTVERRADGLVVSLAEERIPSPARQTGAAYGRDASTASISSIDDLYREFESTALRLGRVVDTVAGQGVLVALDRERGTAVIEFDSGETHELDIRALG